MIQADGKLVATGTSGRDFALARYLNGSVGGLGFAIAPQPINYT